MEYEKMARADLIKEVNRLASLNEYLLKEQRLADRLEFGWTGNLGHWYFHYGSNRVEFNELKVTTLGYDLEELPEIVPYEFFTEKIHPEDYETVMQAMVDHITGEKEVYEVEYRIQAKDGSYKTYHDRGKITQVDENGKPVLIAGIVFDVTQRVLMQEELQEKNRILAEKAVKDSLTDLKNHRALMEEMTKALEISLVTGEPLSVVFFDLDDFKKVNDTYGHQAGDRILIEFSEILKDSLRDSDIISRYGGEEFVVVLPKADNQAALRISDRIRLRVESFEFSGGIKVTVSGGVKTFEGEVLGELIEAADRNLYQAKARGKNRIVG
ncbi:MAG: hypothetical protein AVO33_06550 [delta proteobacterium ML8_F1]|nr:MAG: hypothetical protein AVO33_06550 [delta proteobacterium ML8_F1]